MLACNIKFYKVCQRYDKKGVRIKIFKIKVQVTSTKLKATYQYTLIRFLFNSTKMPALITCILRSG